jgi:3-oxoacyl-[acyl-carrier-protein] synthase-3
VSAADSAGGSSGAAQRFEDPPLRSGARRVGAWSSPLRRPIRLLATGSFLPGDPVPVERTEEVLGPVLGVPPRVDGRARRLAAEVLSRSGVLRRHYALDPVTRRQTETNVSMMEKAARSALDAAGVEAASVDLVITAGPMSDYACPPTSALLQARLGIPSAEEIEIHSNCTGAPKGLLVALDALRIGRRRRALVCYAQLSSVFLRAEYFRPESVELDHLALRWMLSVGAGAIMLDGGADPDGGPSMLDAFVESIAAGRPPGMVGGATGALAHDLALDGRFFFPALHASGLHHVGQDIGAVRRHAPAQLVEGLGRMLDGLGLSGSNIHHFLLGIPGRHFMTDEVKAAFRTRIGVDPDRVPFDVGEFGYCGGATLFVQLDRLLRSDALRRGDLVAAYLEESSLWMSGGCVVSA